MKSSLTSEITHLPTSHVGSSGSSCVLQSGCANANANWITSNNYLCNAEVKTLFANLSSCVLQSGCANANANWTTSSNYLCNAVVKASTSPSASLSGSPLKPSSSSCCDAKYTWLSGTYYLPNQIVRNKVRIQLGGTP